MALQVARSVLSRLRAEARHAAPLECCGLLFGAEGVIDALRPTANVAADCRNRFEIDPRALIDAHRVARNGGSPVAGYYHSHPDGPAEPSATDRALANGDGSVWAIVAAGDVTFWRDGEAGVEPLSYAIEDR